MIMLSDHWQGILLVICLAYFSYHMGRAAEQVEAENLAAAQPPAPRMDYHDMIEECIVRAREVARCQECGHAPLQCEVARAYVDLATGDNKAVLLGVCPECSSVNRGVFDQHYLSMIVAAYEWDRTAMKRDLMELESVDDLMMPDE